MKSFQHQWLAALPERHVAPGPELLGERVKLLGP
jgi:hypothetical protein